MSKLAMKVKQIEGLADELNCLLEPFSDLLFRIGINLRDKTLSERIQIAKLIIEIQSSVQVPE